MKKCFVIAMVLVMILALAACDKSANPADESDTKKTGAENNATYTISVEGLDLKYPEMWQDKVTIDISSDRAAFSCGDIKLFDLVFNGDEGTVLGTVCGDKNIVISIVDYPIDTNDKESLKMLEDVNVILDNLILDYDFVEGKAVEKADEATFNIKTDVVTMRYPAKWKEKVQVSVENECIKFSNDGTPLFDLVFAECDGYLLGVYNGTPIYIVDYSVKTDEQRAMKEDVNVILQFLMEDSSFKLNG